MVRLVLMRALDLFDENMGIERTGLEEVSWVVDSKAGQRLDETSSDVSNDASGRLVDDALNSLHKAGSDQGPERGITRQQSQRDNPFDHIGNAGAALQELSALKNRENNDKVLVSGTDGKVREVSVADRRTELTGLADSELRQAIMAADAIDQPKVEQSLWQVRTQESRAKTLDELAGLLEKESVLEAMQHAPSVTRFAYATYLADQGNWAASQAYLDQIEKIDPEAKLDDLYVQLRQVADEKVKSFPSQTVAAKTPLEKVTETTASTELAQSKVFDDPRDHLLKFEEAYKKADLTTARTELDAAVAAAEKVDRKTIQHNKQVLENELKAETNPAQQETLRQQIAILDFYDHCSAITKLQLGQFELAGKNFNSARALFEQVQKDDPPFAAQPDIKINELMEASNEPSTWGKVWGWTKDALKEVACDGTAILAGVGTAVLTGWSGPAAVGAGALAGSATYTAMKTLVFGEKFHWSMPIWGAVDGVSGGAAALVRSTLTKAAGKIVTREASEAAVTATTKGELANAGKRLAASVIRDAGTAGTMSLVYRGAHEGYNYYSGTHENFSSFAKAYGYGVLGDTTAGAMLGLMGRWLGSGMSSGFVGKATGLEKLASVAPRLGSSLETAWVTSSPTVWQAYATHEHLTSQVEPTLRYLQQPLNLTSNKREFIQRRDTIANYYELKSQGQSTLRDYLRPQIDDHGNVVRPDESFNPETVLSSSSGKQTLEVKENELPDIKDRP
ncbi:MAG: hypothetical protein HY711_00910 [Candidatus Melainabacteria bacterium]|nr:hypothetical protein [Candidatus Melainabacteria bacterium]